MIVIFLLSHQPASQSSALSQGITHTIVNILESIFPITLDISQTHYIIRKMAHFISYLILSLLLSNALGPSKFPTTLTICILYAILDEFHQTLIPGRSGNILDILIDTSGAITGTALYNVVHKIILRKDHKCC